MRKHHPKNERIKRHYFTFLEEAKRMKTTSVDQIAAAIANFEASTGYRDFKQFHIEQARKYKRLMDEQKIPQTDKPLARSTVCSRLRALKAFFQWLAGQQGYRSKISYSDAEYFNPGNNDGRIAGARREKSFATMEQMRHVVEAMPNATDIERRDRALVAFAVLSGARDDAIASMSLKHVNLDKRAVFQDGREVRTKNRKKFTSTFFPVGAPFEAIVRTWIGYLKTEKLFGPDDPLFPSTEIGLRENGLFGAIGINRRHWSSAGPVRRIFKKAFAGADLPYFHPHLLRDTLTQLGERVCRSPEEFKAWSQNLGHERPLTTFTSYGNVIGHRQAEIMNSFAREGGLPDQTSDSDKLARMERMLEELAARD